MHFAPLLFSTRPRIHGLDDENVSNFQGLVIRRSDASFVKLEKRILPFSTTNCFDMVVVLCHYVDTREPCQTMVRVDFVRILVLDEIQGCLFSCFCSMLQLELPHNVHLGMAPY